MAVFNGVFPILPGKEQEGRDSRPRAWGSRRKGFDAQAARTGLARETWALQETPMGSFMLVWFEAPDIEKAFTELATSGDEFSIWFRGQVKDVTGVDLGAPPESPPRPTGRLDLLKNDLPPVGTSPAARGSPGQEPFAIRPFGWAL